MFTNPTLERVYEIGIIPVIAFNSVDEALPLCKALSDGGLPAAEVTFRTACAEECIRLIHKEMPDMLLGAGTVLTKEQVDRAIDAGASFIVAPGFDPNVTQYVIVMNPCIVCRVLHSKANRFYQTRLLVKATARCCVTRKRRR